MVAGGGERRRGGGRAGGEEDESKLPEDATAFTALGAAQLRGSVGHSCRRRARRRRGLWRALFWRRSSERRTEGPRMPVVRGRDGLAKVVAGQGNSRASRESRADRDVGSGGR